MTSPSVLLVPGSIRRDGLHRRFAAALAPLIEERGAVADVVDLADHPMPIYHGDDEAEHGAPDGAVALHHLIAAADGLVFLTPEHNGGPSALLKNAIDWLTRVDREVLRRPLVGLAATSPGSRGAITGLEVTRRIFTHMRLHVFDDDLSVPSGGDAFAAPGAVGFARDDVAAAATEFVDGYVAAVVDHAAARAAVEQPG